MAVFAIAPFFVGTRRLRRIAILALVMLAVLIADDLGAGRHAGEQHVQKQNAPGNSLQPGTAGSQLER